MSARRHPRHLLRATLLCALLSAACATETETPAEVVSPAATRICAIGNLVSDEFQPWPDHSHAELVVGYQGYLFVHVRVADGAGEMLKPNVRMTAECDGLEPSVTTRWRADMSPTSDGGTVSELIELWLYPALRDAFIGKSGRLTVELAERGVLCLAEVKVKYVDDELCMHYEDGSIKCQK